MSSKLTGRIHLPAGIPAGRAAKLLVEIRDVTLQDAPSKVVAHMVTEGVAIAANASLDFDMSLPALAPDRQYSMRVHVDRAGSGRTLPGDLLTTQSYPVTASTRAMDVKLTVV